MPPETNLVIAGPRRPVPAVTLVSAAILGLAIGFIVSWPGLLVAAIATAAAGAATYLMIRVPALTPALFWAALCIQSTIFADLSITGIFYPFYGLMLVNAVISLATGGLRVDPATSITYIVFLVLVAMSLLSVTTALDFTAYQRLFIYALGLFVMTQFNKGSQLVFVNHSQLLSTVVVSGWVVYSSFQANFAHRAGLTIDQNFLSFSLGFGMLVLVARLMSSGPGLASRVLLWLALGLGVYSALLLASRGITVAVAVAVIAMFGRIALDVRRSVPVTLAAVLIGLLMVTLPGSDELLKRFDEANLSTANERLPLWNASIDAFLSASPYEMAFGQGFESSKEVIRAVRGTETSTHNAYLQIIVEFGILGLFAFLAIHMSMLVRFWRSQSEVGLYAIGATVFMLMANLTLTTPDNFIYWVSAGHLMALLAFKREFRTGYLADREAEPS